MDISEFQKMMEGVEERIQKAIADIIEPMEFPQGVMLNDINVPFIDVSTMGSGKKFVLGQVNVSASITGG